MGEWERIRQQDNEQFLRDASLLIDRIWALTDQGLNFSQGIEFMKLMKLDEILRYLTD